jgi:hypothetical protein
MCAFQDVGVWPLDYDKVNGLAYRKDSPLHVCSNSRNNIGGGSNVATNDPVASNAQI